MAGMDMHSRISHNVDVLMAVRQIRTQQDLARLVGIAQPELSKRLRGSRQWRIDDLVKVAGAFGLQPADLLRPVHEVVGAVTATGIGDEQRQAGGSATYPPMISWSMRDKSPEIIPFPQVRASSPCITNVTDKSPDVQPDAQVVHLADLRARRSSPVRSRPTGRIGGGYADSA